MMTGALLAGTLAGLVTFGLQYALIAPLIAEAEAFEAGADTHRGHDTPDEWAPADGIERRLYTLVGTVLTGIGFAALLFGIVSLLHVQLDARRGLLLGVAGFLCVGLAPALGLPPKPPGVPGAPVAQAQLWWMATAMLTAIGLGLMVSSRDSWVRRLAGVLLIASPHLVGAPAAEAAAVVPAALSQRFAVTSVATQGIFWIVLGALCGTLGQRSSSEDGGDERPAAIGMT